MSIVNDEYIPNHTHSSGLYRVARNRQPEYIPRRREVHVAADLDQHTAIGYEAPDTITRLAQKRES